MNSASLFLPLTIQIICLDQFKSCTIALTTMSGPDFAEADGGPLTVSNSTWSLFVEGLSKNPDGAALISLYQPSDHLKDLVGASAKDYWKESHLVWSYRQVERGVTKLATSLSLNYGVEKGSLIASFIWNSAEYILLILAAGKLKATYAPLDPRLLEPDRAEELDFYVAELRPSVIVTTAIDQAIAARLVDERLPRKLLARIVCTNKDLTDGSGAFRDWTTFTQITGDAQYAEANATFPDDEDEYDALILFSSGTTGKPKGIVRSATNMAAQSDFYEDTRRLGASSKVLITALCFRAMCNSWAFCAWRAGAVLVFPSASFSNAETTMNAITSQRCTHFTMVSTTLRSMLHDPSFSNCDFSSLQYLELVGDVVTEQQLTRAQALSPSAVVFPMFGMTEGSAVVSFRKGDAVSFTKTGIASVGRTSPGCRVRICESGTRDIARREEIGDLHVGGLPLLRSYLGGRHEEDFYLDYKGRWFVTGDRAMMDQSGAVYVLGRFKDVISRGGLKLNPILIEKCLEKDENIQVSHILLSVVAPY